MAIKLAKHPTLLLFVYVYEHCLSKNRISLENEGKKPYKSNENYMKMINFSFTIYLQVTYLHIHTMYIPLYVFNHLN